MTTDDVYTLQSAAIDWRLDQLHAQRHKPHGQDHDQSTHGNRGVEKLPKRASDATQAAVEVGRMALEADPDFGLEVYDSTAEATARALTRARMVEPELTEDVTEALDDVGGVPIGLDYRLKGADSALRKITTDAVADDIPGERAAALVSDTVRYTGSFAPESYAGGTSETIGALQERGYVLVKSKNYWRDANRGPGGNPYNGVNTVWEHPETAHRFELQFHTEESFELKDGPLHDLYEEARKPGVSPARKAELEERMADMADELNVPPDADSIVDTRGVTVEDAMETRAHTDTVTWSYQVSERPGYPPAYFRLAPGRREEWSKRDGVWVDAYARHSRMEESGDGFLRVVDLEELPDRAQEAPDTPVDAA